MVDTDDFQAPFWRTEACPVEPDSRDMREVRRDNESNLVGLVETFVPVEERDVLDPFADFSASAPRKIRRDESRPPRFAGIPDMHPFVQIFFELLA